MSERKNEVRTMCGAQFVPHLRESPGTEEGQASTGRTIEGYAIVFGVESVLMVDWWDGPYREVIEPGAVTAEQLMDWDIKMTMFHNREKLLARSNKGSGTLKLSVDEVGVKYEFEAPDTADGNAALELVKRGDLAGSSFTYWSDENNSVRYTKDDEGVLTRHVDKLDMVVEMTIASDPAYVQTNVQAREVLTENEKKAKKAREVKRELLQLSGARRRRSMNE